MHRGNCILRRLPFGSIYVYSPIGSCAVSKRSRLLRTLLKDGDAAFLERYAARACRACGENQALGRLLDPRSVLIPVPGSAPCAAPGESVAARLAQALMHHGIGCSVWPGLQRVHAVQKSATAGAGGRPTVLRHYESLAIAQNAAGLERILLVDDVITKGRTLLAAAARVREAYPQAQIGAFALLRTQGLLPEVNCLLQPCVGEIRWRAGDACRRP